MSLLYQKRRLKVNKIKRKIAANRAFLNRIRILLALIMISGIIYFGLKVIRLSQWYINPEKLANSDPSVIKVQGNLITPNYKITNMVKQTQLPNTQIFRLDTSELEKNISQLQPIKQVFIRRYWFPARLVITVDERTPAFLLSPNLESEPNSILSTDGILIDHDYLPFNPSIKAKRLLTYGVRNGLDEVWDKKRVESLINLTKALEAYSGSQVKYIDSRNQDDIYIMLDDYLIRFGKIDETSLARAKKIAPILPEARKNKAKLKYIDLRWEDSCYLRLEGVKEVSPEGIKNNHKDKNPKSKTVEENTGDTLEEENTIQEENPAMTDLKPE